MYSMHVKEQEIRNSCDDFVASLSLSNIQLISLALSGPMTKCLNFLSQKLVGNGGCVSKGK